MICYRSGGPFGAGIIHGYVDAAKPGDCLIHQAFYFVLEADVRLDKCSRYPFRAELGLQLFAGFVAAAGDDDRRAFISKGEGSCAADACECAGDQYDAF